MISNCDFQTIIYRIAKSKYVTMLVLLGTKILSKNNWRLKYKINDVKL